MEEVATVVLALDQPEIAEEVMHFLDRSGRARVVGAATDQRQLVEAVRQLEPDAVVVAPNLIPARGDLNGSALLALDTTQSVSTLRRAIRAGASGFFLWPAEREELAIAAARIRPVGEHPTEGAGTVIAIYGPRGATGTTFVATHLAASLGRRGRRCVLVDLDPAFADVSAALGVAADGETRTIEDLVPLGDEVSSRHVEDVLWRHPDGFAVLLAPGEPPAIRVRADLYRAAVAAVRSQCDEVVLHLGRGLDELSRAGLEMADRVLVVLGLDVLSFRNARRALEATGVEDRADFVVNRARRAEITPSDVERVFGRAPVAVIPSDRGVARAVERGRLVSRRGRVGRSLDRLARQMTEAR